jgi:hypothetical protein
MTVTELTLSTLGDSTQMGMSPKENEVILSAFSRKNFVSENSAQEEIERTIESKKMIYIYQSYD